MVKQPKIALNTSVDKRCYFNKYESVPWGYDYGDQFLPMK